MSQKSLYTKKLGRVVARDAASNKGRLHIISGGNNWKVVGEGKVRPSRIFASRREAIRYASDVARKQSGMIIVHSETGEIKEELSFAS
jgi:Uncharacterized protein conserved in bacteria (DUF2188)